MKPVNQAVKLSSLELKNMNLNFYPKIFYEEIIKKRIYQIHKKCKNMNR